MAMLKTLYRKKGGCEEIRAYIEKEGRCLAYDYGPNVSDAGDWAASFDMTRKIWGKDDGRKYYHVIISPDPEDDCNLATLRDLATSWMQERYPETEYVIGYHDDNGHLHAHIAMNSVIPDTGYKVHNDDKEVMDDAMTLQRMCKERGLSYFENPSPTHGKTGFEISKGERKRPPVVLSDTERRLIARGIKPWKQDVRDAIDASVAEAASWNDFEKAMSARGFNVRVGRRNTVTFAHPDAEGTKHTVRGTVDNLGSAYTLQGIMLRLPKVDGREYAGVCVPPPRQPIVVPKNIEESIELHGKRRPWLDPQRTLDLIAVMRKNGFASVGELREALSEERRFLDGQRAKLAEARAYAGALDEAAEKVARYVEIDTGEDASALIASIDNLFERRSLEQWFEEHDIDPYAFVENSEDRRQRMRAEVRKIAQTCDEHERALNVLSSAMRTAQNLGMPTPETDADRTARTHGMEHWKNRRRIKSREDLSRLRMRQIEKTAKRFEESGDERLKALAMLQREASLRKQMEKVQKQAEQQKQEERRQTELAEETTTQGVAHEANDSLSQR